MPGEKPLQTSRYFVTLWRRLALTLLAAAAVILSSQAQAGVALCSMPNTDHWTIGLGATKEEATRNAIEINGSCPTLLVCDGNWYAVALADSGARSFACNSPSRASAVQHAIKVCRESGGEGCGTRCVSGFDDKQPARANSGTVWMGNKYTARNCTLNNQRDSN